MAAYNSQETIADSVRSVQAQTFLDWELIVVDDASTDDTGAAMKPFLEDTRIRYVRAQVNAGAGAARNIAASLANGRFYAILDADDISLPKRFELQLAAFSADPALSVVGSQLAEFGAWGGPEDSAWATDPILISAQLERGKMSIAHGSTIIRREDFHQVGGYDEDCPRAEDFALMRKLRKKKMIALPEVLLHYRTNRPITLAYVIASGRSGKLAKVKTRSKNPKPNAKLMSFPRSALVDARSIATWARRWGSQL